MAVNTTPASTSTADTIIQPVRSRPGRSIVKPPTPTAANTSSASAATIR